MHTPYSLDLAPSDYHLFRSPQNSLNDVKLTSKEACENYLLQFFAQNSQFYNDRWFYQKFYQKWPNKRWLNKTAHTWFDKLYLKLEKTTCQKMFH